jgi:hypothetical protein
VTIRNTSSKPEDYNELDFNVVDQKGQTYSPDVFLTDRPELNSGSMPAGEMRSGWMGFEVPTSTTSLTVTWSDAYNLSPPAEIAHLRVRV